MKSNSAAKPRKFRPTPISPRTLRRMKERVELMRWSSHETDDEIRPGSLADTFWNKDIPRLMAYVEQAHKDIYGD